MAAQQGAGQGGLKSSGLCSKCLYFQVSEPRGIWPRRRSRKQGLQKEAERRRPLCPLRVWAHRNALTVEPLFMLAWKFFQRSHPKLRFLTRELLGVLVEMGYKRGRLRTTSSGGLLHRNVHVSWPLSVCQPQGSLLPSVLYETRAGTLQTTFPRLLAGLLPTRVPYTGGIHRRLKRWQDEDAPPASRSCQTPSRSKRAGVPASSFLQYSQMSHQGSQH